MFTCLGFLFFFTCEPGTPTAAPTGAAFCDVYTPISWSAKDTRLTKEQVDTMNRIWKELECGERGKRLK